MVSIKPCKNNFQALSLLKPPTNYSRPTQILYQAKKALHGKFSVRATQGGEGGEKRSFLSLEEAGLVEMSGLSTHERFLCRLTISSLNLLRVVSEQEGVPIEELNAGRICDWFLKDKLKREQDLGSAVLQWDESEFPM
ncbi:hypothetical protein QJS10_CPB11g01026 [Acorus calamus]|uniref:Receptor-interacting protein n=1 Tax=Acorus calamus TaxID=4465 RepID=A0AAV9DX85_ACOCL|nr:hypothetical protein QJS10_CPB11g01026 [Acorus calamus]